jgi:hypothetical protein
MNSAINSASSTSRGTITATVGFMCLGLMIWVLGMSSAGWFDKLYPGGIAMLTLSIVLAIIAILTFVDQRTLDAVIFFGGAGMLASYHAFLTATGAGAAAEPAHYGGWLDIIWAVYFFYVWLAARKADPMRMLFLLGLWLALLAFALRGWGLGHILEVIGGYLLLATAILAIIVSASAILARGDAGSAPSSA